MDKPLFTTRARSVGVAVSLALATVAAQGPQGAPDLQGIWTYATLTPLERPDEFAGKAFLTDAEAAAFERKTLEVQNRDRRDGDGPAGRGPDGRTDLDRAYNQVWWEYGAKVVGTRKGDSRSKKWALARALHGPEHRALARGGSNGAACSRGRQSGWRNKMAGESD